jgi:hypothetical protein
MLSFTNGHDSILNDMGVESFLKTAKAVFSKGLTGSRRSVAVKKAETESIPHRLFSLFQL